MYLYAPGPGLCLEMAQERVKCILPIMQGTETCICVHVHILSHNLGGCPTPTPTPNEAICTRQSKLKVFRIPACFSSVNMAGLKSPDCITDVAVFKLSVIHTMYICMYVVYVTYIYMYVPVYYAHILCTLHI